MALDTLDKRASIAAIGPIPLLLPSDGLSTEAGREQVAGLYRMNEVTPTPPSGTGFLTPMRVSQGF